MFYDGFDSDSFGPIGDWFPLILVIANYYPGTIGAFLRTIARSRTLKPQQIKGRKVERTSTALSRVLEGPDLRR